MYLTAFLIVFGGLVILRFSEWGHQDLNTINEHKARVLIGGSTRLRARARTEYLEMMGEKERDYDDVFYTDVK